MGETVIAYLHGENVRAEFSHSLLLMCLETEVPVSAVMAISSGPNLSAGRNLICRLFLEQHDAPWLFMCDTDMVFQLDTLDQLAAAADPAERPVLGALCHRKTLQGSAEPTIYQFSGLVPFTYPHYPENAVMRVEGTGAACLLIHRSVLEAVEKDTGDVAAPWFREIDSGMPGQLLGEDLTFCLRCAQAGIPIHVHTGIRVGHVKSQIMGG